MRSHRSYLLFVFCLFLMFSPIASAQEGEFYLVGHAHIDLSWLWTPSETIHEVCPLTFESVNRLMDQYPDFVFAQSAAQTYKWMERYYPEVFRHIKRRVEQGRWEIVGGAWDEHNTNIPSGESLVRQYLYGKRYFKEKFGVDVKVGWLPDVFGFNWNMPQIYRKCGIDYFMTHKLKWQVERNDPPVPFPYHLFWWQGPDGSRVLAFHTVGDYNEKVIPKEMLEDLGKLKDKHGIDKLMIVFGRGDHGGGPMPDMLHRADSLRKVPNFPTIHFSKANAYFDMIKASSQSAGLPVINDELYVKTHRGCLTTDSQVKRDNRLCETLLLNAEKFSVLASLLDHPYPQEELHNLWEKLLFGQVHDNIDGSSVKEVYQAAATDYAELKIQGNELLNQALQAISKNMDTQGEGDAIIIYNPATWERNDMATVCGCQLKKYGSFQILDDRGIAVPYQMVPQGDCQRALFKAQNVPALGYKQYRVKSQTADPKVATDLKAKGLKLTNSFLQLEVDQVSGNIVSLKRKGLKADFFTKTAPGNALEVWEDLPPKAPSGEPAWNIYLGECHKLDQAQEVSLVESGPLRAVVRVKKSFGKSTFEQDIILYAYSDRVDFEFRGDWHEQYKFAKVAFPLNLQAYFATYEIPFGAIDRYDFSIKQDPGVPLQEQGRPWEMADRTKTENAAQRWVDVSDKSGRFGASLLNDSKYGFSFAANTLRMSLIRGPRRGYPRTPDSFSDQSDIPYVGVHKVRYALVPHEGNWKNTQVVRQGIEFNTPLLVKVEPAHAGQAPKAFAGVKVEPENVIIEAVKKAEDSGAAIIRMYEAYGKNCEATVTFADFPESVQETDMLEWDQYVLPKSFTLAGKTVKVPMTHHEVKTLKVQF